MIQAADFIVDIGPKAGLHGGQIISAGTLKTILESDSLTALYLNEKKTIEIP
jgi:Excinuclease ATPase subunit